MPGVEWLELAARWLHVVAAIAWIGTSFYFIGLGYVLRPPEEPGSNVEGEAWEVHGGGFYRVAKLDVAPERMPSELHWFKWEAYTTWLSGAALLILVYYMGADAFLLDGSAAAIGPAAGIAIGAGTIVGGWALYEALCRSPLAERRGAFAVVGLVLVTLVAFALSQVLSGRAAYLHVGAALGTMMAANVFFVIIPAHKDLVAAVEEGREPDAAVGIAASHRSLHNNYLTLPVVFLMISNHYPITYAHPHGWAILGGLALLGGWIRHAFNLRHRGRGRPWMWALAAAGAIALAAAAVATGRAGVEAGSAAGPVSFGEVRGVIARRCAVCHSADPVHPAFPAPPAGITFDSPEEIRARADRIRAVTVETRVMPLGNLTDMTEEERALVGRWATALGAGP